jgi:hypothetical protein
VRHPLLDRTGPVRRFAPLIAGIAAVATLSKCSENAPSQAPSAATLLPTSPEARARIQAIRARIPGAPQALPPRDLGFEATPDGRVRPVFPTPPGAGHAGKTATVELPSRASAEVRLSDDTTPFAVSFTLDGAAEAELAVAEGIALYAGAAPGGGDILHRVLPMGTEDLVFFERAPGIEALRYRVDVSAAAGLRLVSSTLEFLDPSGTPRLRVAPPYLLDATGKRLTAALSVEGCAVDTSPRAPWGRPVTPPGGSACDVRVDWSQAGARYPVLVDPIWQATENLMVRARTRHTLTLLNPSGNKSLALLAGGFDAAEGAPLATAELYDPLSRRFSPTGDMKAKRGAHTATLLAIIVSPPDADRPVLIAGGSDTAGAPLDSLEVYEPSSGQFFLDPNKMTGTPRFDHTATLFDDNKVLLAGGISVPLNQPTNTAFVYTFTAFGAGNVPTSSLVPTGPMASSRTLHAAARLRTGDVLLCGGVPLTGDALQTAELFDKASSQFTLLQLPLPAISVMSAPRARHTATVLDSEDILITGGVNKASGGTFTSTADVFKFDPSKNIKTFQPVSDVMKSPRADHTATRLTTGDVLIAGGFNGASALPDTEVFSATTQAFTVLSAELPMLARGDHAALLVNAGEAASGGKAVLVTGGTGASTKGTAALQAAQILLRKAGDACTRNDECLTGFCADSVCCDTACDEECFACSKATSVLDKDGVCGFAKQGSDPRSQCINELEVHTQCDGKGSTEQTLETHDCKPGTCAANGETCSQGCVASNECSFTGWCDLSAPDGGVGQCQDKAINSSQCTRNEQCESDHCVDGLCCDLACEGQCQACDLPGFPGKCLPVGSVAEPADPHPNQGVAPRSACAGLVEGQKTGCSGYCDGTKAAACTYPGDKAQRKEPTCADKEGEASVVTVYPCAGDGSSTEKASSCDGFRCADAHACKTSCVADADCITDHVCVPDSEGKNTCKLLDGPLCDGKFTLRKPTAQGGNAACPDHYTCPAGAAQCRTDCDSVNDCVDAFVCDAAHKCVPQLTAPPLPGCSCRIVGEGGEGAPPAALSALALAALALAASRRSFRRGS